MKRCEQCGSINWRPGERCVECDALLQCGSVSPPPCEECFIEDEGTLRSAYRTRTPYEE
jgi:hypothetical protein